MKESQIAVFNYFISYYLIRIFGLFWLLHQFFAYSALSKRPALLYEPTFDFQKILFPEFPSNFMFIGLLVFTGILFITSIFRPSVLLNVLLFLSLACVNLPLSAQFGVHHDQHLFILSFFLSLFLLPKNLSVKDYRWVQFYYLGLLITYTFAGFSKIAATFKNLFINNPKLLWIDKNAAWYNTIDSYYRADEPIPEWMSSLYQYEYLWVVLTVFGILLQFLSFLGAYNRKWLTFFMLFLVTFHWYTKNFVLADFDWVHLFILVAFFPYHLLTPKFIKTKWIVQFERNLY